MFHFASRYSEVRLSSLRIKSSPGSTRSCGRKAVTHSLNSAPIEFFSERICAETHEGKTAIAMTAATLRLRENQGVRHLRLFRQRGFIFCPGEKIDSDSLVCYTDPESRSFARV